MNYELPKSVAINGRDFQVRSDFRAILDIFCAINDPELTQSEKSEVALTIFYPELHEMKRGDLDEALKNLYWFINGGEEVDPNEPSKPKLVDWEKDFPYIIAPINRAAGKEVRALKYMHWWTFLSLYNDIDGESTFAFIVRIRDKLRRHKKLDETEKRFYRENRKVVDIETRYSEAETSVLEEWTKLNG